MKKFLVSIFLLNAAASGYAQIEKKQDNKAPMSIDVIMQACIGMQESIENNDVEGLAKAAAAMRESGTRSFNSLRCLDEKGIDSSLDGHFIFSEVFVDSLQNSSNAYENADRINREGRRRSTNRGQTSNGSALTKTCMVKAGKSTRYSFPSKGHQELGIVAEPGGLVSVRIHATNNDGLDEWHNDTANPNGSRRFRIAFDLPKDNRNTVELEIINKSPKDISFVVISN